MVMFLLITQSFSQLHHMDHGYLGLASPSYHKVNSEPSTLILNPFPAWAPSLSSSVPASGPSRTS